MGGARRIRVSIPLAGFNLSGGVKSLVAVANALAARGHAVRILAPDYAATPPAPLASGVRLTVLTAGPRRLPAPARKLIHLARLALNATAGADVCLANYWTTAYIAVTSKWLHGDHTILAYNVRGYEPLSHGLNADASLPSRLVRALLAWISYRLPLQQICTTEWLRQQTGDRSAYVVGHGIDLNVFKPGPAREPGETVTVGTIGRLGEAKGYPDFLRAVEQLPTDLPIRFSIAAPDEVELPTRFPSSVAHPKPEREMSEFYAACDIFVFSSRGEGFGLPALEAMAVGCPVITTDSGGVRQFAAPDENCLMTPPADPAALARAILALVRDPERRAALRQAGMTTAAGYAQDAVLERFCRYLERLSRR
ncbi:MAG: glycosyltransferase family 4 protein [Chloroflexi bacterium]|nr:glycosyltransferase family 4 protein [Chloroflexota bacterium]